MMDDAKSDSEKLLLIFGAGGHAAKLVSIANELRIPLAGYISTEQAGTRINGLEVLGDLSLYLQSDQWERHPFIIGIGETGVRVQILQALPPNRAKNMISLVSRSAYVDTCAETGAGTCMLPGSIIHPQARTGVSCIIDSGAIVEHHVHIGDFVNISPGAILCGGVQVDSYAVIGAGAVVIEKVRIGRNALVGAGAVVIRDVPPDTVVAGNPARILRKRSFTEPYLR